MVQSIIIKPYERLEKDIAMMKEMNLTVVRVGESTWHKWESEDGVFEFGSIPLNS